MCNIIPHHQLIDAQPVCEKQPLANLPALLLSHMVSDITLACLNQQPRFCPLTAPHTPPVSLWPGSGRS